VWTYVNLPLLDITLFAFPILLLLGWIPLVGIWIDLFEIVKGKHKRKRRKNKKFTRLIFK
jgi:hypothetical protein